RRSGSRRLSRSKSRSQSKTRPGRENDRARHGGPDRGDHRSALTRLAVLFGAGASKGAGAVAPHPPPLGGELYDALVETFPDSWGALVTDEEDAALRGEPPFEPGMDMIWRASDERAQRLVIDMALYFTDFRPPADASDCYSEFFRALRRLPHEFV